MKLQGNIIGIHLKLKWAKTVTSSFSLRRSMIICLSNEMGVIDIQRLDQLCSEVIGKIPFLICM